MLSRWILTEEERNKYIDALKDNLAVLRVGEVRNISRRSV